MSRNKVENVRLASGDVRTNGIKGPKSNLRNVQLEGHQKRCSRSSMGRSTEAGFPSNSMPALLPHQESNEIGNMSLCGKTVAGFSEHAEGVLRLLHGMWQTRHLCDMVVNVDGETLPVHRLALAACSETFKSKLCSHQPADIKELFVTDTTVEATEIVLKYMYTLELVLDEDVIEPVLSCALQLGITTVVEASKSYLLQFNLDNVMRYIEIAEKHQLLDVFSQIHQFVCIHFVEISGSVEFLTYRAETLCRLLSDDNLVVVSELDVFLAVQRWIEHDLENRMKFAIDLMKLVRLCRISPEDLALHVETCHYIFQIPECHHMLFSALRYQALKLSESYLANTIQVPPERRSQVSGESIRTIPLPTGIPNENKSSNCIVDIPKTPTTKQNVDCIEMRNSASILTVGGLNPTEPSMNRVSRLVNEYNPLTNSWATLATLPDRRHHQGVVLLDAELYIIGGSTVEKADSGHPSPTNTCYKFELAGQVWSQLPSMRSRRVYHSVVTFQNLIYVLGGQDGLGKPLNTVECFDPSLNSWNQLPAMSSAKSGATAVVFHDSIFVLGGFRESGISKNPLATVECFDPVRKCWIEKHPLPSPIAHACAVVAADSLLLIGGATVDSANGELSSLATVYHYVHEDDTWRFFTNLHVPRHSAAAVTLGSYVYVLGGLSTVNGQALSSVECLDIGKGSWVLDVRDLPQPALALGACVSSDVEEVLVDLDS